MRPAIAQPLDVDLGDSVRLLAVDAPKTAKLGAASIDVTLTFEAKRRVGRGWKLFVHAYGPGKQMANSDHEPARPFEWWKAGDIVRYTRAIALPRAGPGKYTLGIGLFRGDERAHVAAPRGVTIDNDEATVATIEVTQ